MPTSRLMKSAFLFFIFTYSAFAANSTGLYLRGVVAKNFDTKIKETSDSKNPYTIESFINNDQKVKIFISPEDQKYITLNDIESLKNKTIQTVSFKKNQKNYPSHVTINIMNN